MPHRVVTLYVAWANSEKVSRRHPRRNSTVQFGVGPSSFSIMVVRQFAALEIDCSNQQKGINRFDIANAVLNQGSVV